MLGDNIAGSLAAIIFLILGLVEIAPIKISPLQWIGKRVNAETLSKVKSIEVKLDNHIAQSLRTKILTFQDDILAGKVKTKEQWKEVINAITQYEFYCENNNISNGLCREASDFLREDYRTHLHRKDFARDLLLKEEEHEA